MRAAVNALAILSAAAALQLAPRVAVAEADAAPSERSAQQGADRWVPSLAPTLGASIQNWKSALESQICRGCTFPNPSSQSLRPAASGGDRDVTPSFGGNLELMTPELPLPTRPRLFVGGEIAATFGVDRTLALEGDPGSLSSPFPPGTVNQPFNEGVVLGQGSKTDATLGSPFYGAYAGIAFPFQVYGRQLRIKPAFAWMRYTVDVEGTVLDAECLDKPPPRPASVPPNLCNTIVVQGVPVQGILREIQMTGSDTGTFNGIGPGLDIEMDTGVLGPLGTSIFLGGRAYRILGERTIEFDATESFPDQGPGLSADQTRAQWSFEAAPWMYRVFVGFRVQWLGFAP
jgi:hypothetical protein